MNRRRRVSTAAIAAVVASLALTACVGAGDGSGAAGAEQDTAGEVGAPAAADGDRITLDYWHGYTGPDGPVVTQVIQEFNASQDRIEVVENPMPHDVLAQRLMTSLATPDGPDIITLGTTDLPQYAATGALAPLDDWWDSDEWMDVSVLPEAARAAGTFEGVSFGVPKTTATQMLYWNKAMFEAAGLDPEAPPATWEEFAEVARQLTLDENGDGQPEQFGFAIGDHNASPVYQLFMSANGGGVVSEDGVSLLASDETIEALEFWTSLVLEDKVSPVGLSGADADNLFRTERAAMQIVGPWMTGAFSEAGIDFGIAPPPAGSTDFSTWLEVSNFTVNAGSSEEEQAAAKEFFAFWNSVEAQILWADGAGFPPNRSDVSAEDLANPFSALFGDPAVIANAEVYIPGLAAGRAIEFDVVQPAIQRILNKQGSVREIMQAADAEATALLAE